MSIVSKNEKFTENSEQARDGEETEAREEGRKEKKKTVLVELKANRTAHSKSSTKM